MFGSVKLLLILIFSSPFNIDIETVPDELQMELMDLQNNTDLRNKFHNVNTQKFKLKVFFQNHSIFEKFLGFVKHEL